MRKLHHFPCTIIHTDLFPTPLFDPFNPLKIKIITQVSPDKLTFLAYKDQAKILGSELTSRISNISVHLLSANNRRFETFQRTLIRIGLIAIIVFLWTLIKNRYGLGLSLGMALLIACFIAPLNFLLNGGFSIKGEIYRFIFFIEETGKSFSLDVLPENAPGFRTALRTTGMKFEDDIESDKEWFCEECGAIVNAADTKCPQCGASFDEEN